MGDRKHILVVEDERVVARDIQRSLTDLGYEVPATAATGDQAIGLVAARCPDLVLMDIRIKGNRDGIETARILRERFDVPVVYLTAYADAPTVERAKATGPLGYLLKPVKALELRSTVELALYKHETDRRMREREHWLAATLRSIGDAVISTDADGRVDYMNPIAEALTGEPLAGALGRPCRDVLQLVDERTLEVMENPMEQALRAGETVHVDGVLSALAGDGRLVSDSTAPIVDDRGRILGSVMVFRDVSEKRRIARELDLAERLATVGTMAASIAYELNNPLAVVVANLALAVDEVRRHLGEAASWTGPVERALEEAARGAADVTRIAADLGAFSRSDRGDAAVIDVCEVIERSLELAAGDIGSGAEVVVELGAVPDVEADPTRLLRVVSNLVTNAAQAMAPGGRLTIVSRTDAAGRAVIEVADTGCGMSAEVRRRAFEPFFTTRENGGTRGLGLAICHGIVASLGGEIELESEPGVGTTARVVLPAACATAPACEVPPPPSRSSTRGSILVVDDQPLVLSAIERVLGGEQALTCSGTAREALELIERGTCFDLILCDLMMPDMNGVDLHRELLARHPDQARRMVFLTGGAFTPETLEFIRSVPNRRAEKPFDPSALRGLVRQVLDEYGSSA